MRSGVVLEAKECYPVLYIYGTQGPTGIDLAAAELVAIWEVARKDLCSPVTSHQKTSKNMSEVWEESLIFSFMLSLFL